MVFKNCHSPPSTSPRLLLNIQTRTNPTISLTWVSGPHRRPGCVGGSGYGWWWWWLNISSDQILIFSWWPSQSHSHYHNALPDEIFQVLTTFTCNRLKSCCFITIYNRFLQQFASLSLLGLFLCSHQRWRRKMLNPSTSSFLSTRLSEPSLKRWRCSRWDKSWQLAVDMLFLYLYCRSTMSIFSTSSPAPLSECPAMSLLWR